MAKIAPQLPIEVDSETGVWTSDALPIVPALYGRFQNGSPVMASSACSFPLLSMT